MNVLLHGFDRLCRYANSDYAGGDLPGDDRAAADDGPRANFRTGKKDTMCTEKTLVRDLDSPVEIRIRVLISGNP